MRKPKRPLPVPLPVPPIHSKRLDETRPAVEVPTQSAGDISMKLTEEMPSTSTDEIPIKSTVEIASKSIEENTTEATVEKRATLAEETVTKSTEEMSSANNDEMRKRKSKSTERQRNESDSIELSDSDDDIGGKSPQPIITLNDDASAEALTYDEPDASISVSTVITAIADVTTSNNTLSTSDEPAICVDNSITCSNDATYSDKSQMSYDEILQIDESLRDVVGNDDDDASDIELHDALLNQSIIVEIHDVPTIELKIHESDSDESAFGTIQLTKEPMTSVTLDVDRERCYSEDDAIDSTNEMEKEKALERAVQSDSEILTKTPIELVVTCDINENVVLRSVNATQIIDFDHNHNDIVKCVDSDGDDTIHSDIETVHSDVETMHSDADKVHEIQSMGSSELRRVSFSSRSSFDESDAEPMYATVDMTANMVSIRV